MSFRSEVEKITRDGRDKEIEEASLTDAWNEAYTSMDVEGGYHLYEDGFYVGDANKNEILKDAEKRGIKIKDIDDPVEMLAVLDDEFIEIYRENVENEIEEVV